MAGTSYLDILRWSDEDCRDYLEAQRWPDGPVCPKCGATEPWTITRKSATKNQVSKLYKCRQCRKQFTATVGTIFEDSKIPLHKWFAAIAQMCASKKGVSAHQIHRELGVTYKSAWFMCHRIREAMKDKNPALLGGTVEADETYVGGKPRGPRSGHGRTYQDSGKSRKQKAVVFGIRERGGQVRTIHVPDAKGTTLRPIILSQTRPGTALMTDINPAYRQMGRHMRHEMVNHDIEYVRGDVHTQGIEGYWSILKRGINGTFHHVGVGYLGHYLHEFDYRFNSRKVSDAERFASLLRQTQGRLEWFCQNPQAENPYA